MKELKSYWYREELTWDEWKDIRSLPLLYIHNLHDGLERYLIERIGAHNWEANYYKSSELESWAMEAGVPRSFDNWKRLRYIMVDLEMKEIRELTGRAA